MGGYEKVGKQGYLERDGGDGAALEDARQVGAVARIVRGDRVKQRGTAVGPPRDFELAHAAGAAGDGKREDDASLVVVAECDPRVWPRVAREQRGELAATRGGRGGCERFGAVRLAVMAVGHLVWQAWGRDTGRGAPYLAAVRT